MRKILCAILCLAMVASMAACTNNDPVETTPVETTTVETTEAETPPEETTVEQTEAPVDEVVAEAAPEAKYTYAFDGDLGAATVVLREGDNENGGNAGTIPAAGEYDVTYSEGKNGQAIFLDGKYGLNLNAAPIGDTYSLSFWVSADRFSDFGAIIQCGSDLLSAEGRAAWLNITRTTWGTDGAPLAPVVWSRNEALDVWPWFSGADELCIEKKTWYHITVVVDGATAGSIDGMVAGTLYVDGVKVGAGDVAAKTFAADDSVMYVGINCWDVVFKGYFDDIMLYDTALTDGQVKGLLQILQRIRNITKLLAN